MRPTSTKPGERIDLPSLFQTAAEHSDDAFGETLLQRQELLWEHMRDERLLYGGRRFVKNGGYLRWFKATRGVARIRV